MIQRMFDYIDSHPLPAILIVLAFYAVLTWWAGVRFRIAPKFKRPRYHL